MYGQIVQNIDQVKPKTILDASCGTGNLLTYCNQLSQIQKMHFTCVDFSQVMLNIAQRKSVNTTTRFAHTDLNKALPYDSESFDMVVSINTLYAVKNPEKTLKEFYRILIKGGVLILANPLPETHGEIILREHAKSTLPLSHWKKPRSETELKQLIASALPNKLHQKQLFDVAQYDSALRLSNSSYFFDVPELERLLQYVKFDVVKSELAYAQQNILLMAKKRCLC